MTFIGILLIIVGVIGIFCGMFAIGDIGIACMIGGFAALLSGIGFLVGSGRIKKLEKKLNM